jgi:isocitrate dehydrogenase
MGYKKIQVPAVGDKITVNADHSLNVPDNPIIPSSKATALASTSAR